MLRARRTRQYPIRKVTPTNKVSVREGDTTYNKGVSTTRISTGRASHDAVPNKGATTPVGRTGAFVCFRLFHFHQNVEDEHGGQDTATSTEYGVKAYCDSAL